MPACIWRKTMQLKNKIKTDRSGKISTILLAVIVIIVVVIVAVALYVVLTGNNSDDNSNTEKEIGLGTTVSYDVEGSTDFQSITMEFIGQNSDNYFVKTTADGVSWYEMTPKDSNSDDYNVVDTQEMSTIDGDMTLAVVEYSDGTTAYIDQETGLPYQIDIPGGLICTLKEYNLKTQDKGSYKESDAIGMINKYQNGPYSANLECVADCMGGQYGVEFIGMFLLCDDPLGLPVDASDAETTLLLNVDGNDVVVEIWEFMYGTYSMGYDPESKMIYCVTAPTTDGTTVSLCLFESQDKDGTQTYDVFVPVI